MSFWRLIRTKFWKPLCAYWDTKIIVVHPRSRSSWLQLWPLELLFEPSTINFVAFFILGVLQRFEIFFNWFKVFDSVSKYDHFCIINYSRGTQFQLFVTNFKTLLFADLNGNKTTIKAAYLFWVVNNKIRTDNFQI